MNTFHSAAARAAATAAVLLTAAVPAAAAQQSAGGQPAGQRLSTGPAAERLAEPMVGMQVEDGARSLRIEASDTAGFVVVVYPAADRAEAGHARMAAQPFRPGSLPADARVIACSPEGGTLAVLLPSEDAGIPALEVAVVYVRRDDGRIRWIREPIAARAEPSARDDAVLDDAKLDDAEEPDAGADAREDAGADAGGGSDRDERILERIEVAIEDQESQPVRRRIRVRFAADRSDHELRFAGTVENGDEVRARFVLVTPGRGEGLEDLARTLEQSVELVDDGTGRATVVELGILDRDQLRAGRAPRWYEVGGRS